MIKGYIYTGPDRIGFSWNRLEPIQVFTWDLKPARSLQVENSDKTAEIQNGSVTCSKSEIRYELIEGMQRAVCLSSYKGFFKGRDGPEMYDQRNFALSKEIR
ncbi:hypothetical protein ACROYT_G015248 [Oculina patagonica]